MIRIIVQAISFGLFIFLFSKNTYGQFTYMGVGVEYNFTSYYSGSHIGNRTANSNFGISGEVLFRPWSFLAIGGSYTHVIQQNSSFTFNGSPSRGGYSFSSFNGFSPITNGGRYLTDTFYYNLDHGNRTAIYVKLFPAPKLGFYVEAGFVFSQVDESFDIKRSEKSALYYSDGSYRYGPLPALDFQFNRRYLIKTPVFGLGWIVQSEKNIYFDLSIPFMVIRYPEHSFELEVPYEWNIGDNQHVYVLLAGQATGVKISPALSVKAGFFF